MKKILLIGLAIVTMVACDDLSELNEDLKNPQEVPAGALFANATKNMVDFMTTPNVNVNNFRLWAQQWAQTTYADESNYELVERNVNGRTFNTIYVEVIRDLREAGVFIEANQNLSDVAKKNQLAMAEVMEIYAWHVLVDIFGDVPYSESFNEDPKVVEPAFDDDQAIYQDLMVRLDAAIADLGGDSRMGDFDIIYGGDADLWKRFANSLKLRLAWRTAAVNQSQAITKAQEAASSGLISSVDQQFMLSYESSTPNTNPLWVSLVQSGRSDFIAASTIVDPMVARNDPRLDDYFKDQISGEFKGGVYGSTNAYPAFSHPGLLQEDPTFEGVLMSYWEVAFLLADFEERGASFSMVSEYYPSVTMDTPEEFYNEGITASIVYWGNTVADAQAYLAQPNVAYATATGTNFQKIALQKWISLYDQGFEAWSTYRFYDYPVLPIAAQAGIPTPKRYTYPVSEYSLNEANVRAAGTAIGGDALDTPVFWDVN